MAAKSFDVVLVGGGLQSGLLVLALRARRPRLRIALVEREERLGGNHTWCFHTGALSTHANDWFAPLAAHRWDGYDVRFPGLVRRLEHPYVAVTSERLHQVVWNALADVPGCGVWLGREAVDVAARSVRLDDGTRLKGDLVVDARGLVPVAGDPGSGTDGCAPDAGPFGPASRKPRAGYQKFVGLELELDAPHALERPLLMDARVDQSEGFRFFYVLPLAPDRLLVEDTRFHESPVLERTRLREAVLGYAAAQGWSVSRVVREETGVLPMPWESEAVSADAGPLRAGYGGGWFHPATGYSFPVAARLAEAVAEAGPRAVHDGALRRLAAEQERQCSFARLLNRLLFRWYPPHTRTNVFERFYRLPASTIARFYALRTTVGDRARILLGRPPAGLSPRYRFQQGLAPGATA